MERTQTELFDLGEGLKRKDEGQQRVMAHDKEAWLAEARAIARQVCREIGSVTSDDVLAQIGKPVGVHHNLIGCIFKTGEFRRIGYQQTERPSGHGRAIGIWELLGGTNTLE